MEHPRRLLLRSSGPPLAEDGSVPGKDLGLHEQVAEGAMGQVGVQGRHDHFRVARHLDLAGVVGQIGEGDAADLDVVFGRHADLGVRFDGVIDSAVLGARLHEDRLVALGLASRRLIGGRPVAARLAIAQVDERAVAVARRVLAPTRHGQIAPAAVSAARVGGHDVVAAVRQQVDLGQRRVRVGEHAMDGARLRGGGASCLGHLVRARVHDDRMFRHPFLQQQLGGADQRVGKKAALHRSIEQRMRERQQAHPLVVGHEAAHDGVVRPREHARRGVVDGFVQPVVAEKAGGGEGLQIATGVAGDDRQRERGRVGSDDQVLRQSALEAQPGNAERAVLIDLVHVDGVVARLRDAPGNVTLPSVVDLARDGGPGRPAPAACSRSWAGTAAA